MPTLKRPPDAPCRATVLVAHSSPVVALGLARILAERRGAVVDLVDAEAQLPSPESAPRRWLTIGDAAGVRAHRRHHPRSHAVAGARLMIASSPTGGIGCAAPWLALDVTETALLAAVDQWLAEGAVGEAAGRNPGRGFAPGRRACVLAHIERHLDQPLDAEALARLVGVSTCHFARAFKQSFGAPPQRFVLQRRLEQAAHRLRLQAGSLSAIALEFGFADQSHFTRCFGRWLGETPSAYRARFRDAPAAPGEPGH